MNVERIFISLEHGAAQIECDQITVQRGMGILGDRNFGKAIYPGQNLTLVEAEEIELFCKENARIPDLSITRRNIVTRGVRLNEFVNKEFRIGVVKLRGIELCEPCSLFGSNLSTESFTAAAIVKRWLHRGGLRVDVLSDGEIGCGARIETYA
jgi:MOSC domain-containing protein YiiM